MQTFTVYSITQSPDCDKASPYIVYDVRYDNGETLFLIANKDGIFRWHDSNSFREKQSQVH
jgi:hypothetical protein